MKNTATFLFAFALIFSSCSKDGNLNLFSVNDDIALGRQLDSTIMSDPQEYPILPAGDYAEVYDYVEGIMNTVLTSDEVYHKDIFPWQVRIINKDVLNAFAAPGGYLYFYTGFIKYADSEAELAGVMAHEIAHADRRHSSERLTKVYGMQFMLGMLVGNNQGQLSQIATQMALGGAALKFSRNDEYEADEYSVRYLNSVSSIKNYDATAIMDFFDRMNADSLSQGNGSFEFLRTHPYDDNRRTNVNEIWKELGSPVGQKFEAEHRAIISKLP